MRKQERRPKIQQGSSIPREVRKDKTWSQHRSPWRFTDEKHLQPQANRCQGGTGRTHSQGQKVMACFHEAGKLEKGKVRTRRSGRGMLGRLE